MKIVVLILFAVLTVSLLYFLNAEATAMCNYNVSGYNSMRFLNNTCSPLQITFVHDSSNNKVVCNDSVHAISMVIFENNTYNNTLINCTFGNATLKNLHDSFNNILDPRGNYTLSFSDSNSNIALGYYFTFVPRDVSNNIVSEDFATVNPWDLAKVDIRLFDNQILTRSLVEEVANNVSYTLPRFGDAVLVGSSGLISFALETEQISKDGTKSFNPYWFICPYWGYDIISYLKFNLTSNKIYTPLFIMPQFETNIQLPDSTSVFWNFTTRNYNGATNITAYIFAGYQFEPPAPVKIVRNYTGENLSYQAGIQKPGIYQFIGQLRATHNKTFEQSNSTTMNYGVGIAFCTQNFPPIHIPGYYSMVFKSLNLLNIFFPTNIICQNALTIQSNNITIDCKNGAINSTGVTVSILNSENVTLENCNIFGNAITAINSQLKIINTTIRANNLSNIAFSGFGSNVELVNTIVFGYNNYSNFNDSSISVISAENTS